MTGPYKISLDGKSDHRGNSIKRMHFTHGLGDGNVYVQTQQQQGLRGRKRYRRGNDNDNIIVAPHLINADHAKNPQYKKTKSLDSQESLSVDDLMENLRADLRATVSPLEENYLNQGVRYATQNDAFDGPWQLSVIILFGIIGVLIALFIHFATDMSGLQNSYLRSKIKKKVHYKSPNYRKKTDDWSDDASITEDDDYKGDTEATVGNTVSGGIAKKRMNVPSSPMPTVPNDPTARLYYPLHSGNNYRQQEHRLRKPTTTVDVTLTPRGNGPIDSRRITLSAFQTPSRSNRPPTIASSDNNKAAFSSERNRLDKSPGVIGPSPKIYTSLTTQCSLEVPMPPFLDHINRIGSEIVEVDESISRQREVINCIPASSNTHIKNLPTDSGSNDFSGEFTNSPAVMGYMRVKHMGTFTPSESFVAMPSEGSEEDEIYPLNTSMTSDTPPDTSEEQSQKRPTEETPPNFLIPSVEGNLPRLTSMMTADEAAIDFPTPRVENNITKRDISLKIMEKGNLIDKIPLPFSEIQQEKSAENWKQNNRYVGHLGNHYDAISLNNVSSGFLEKFSNILAVPNLDNEPPTYDYRNTPHSVLLEELHLIRMESGVQPRWISEIESSSIERAHPSHELQPHSKASKTSKQDRRDSHGNNEKFWNDNQDTDSMRKRRQAFKNMEKLREASSVMDPSDDPRNSIQHIRQDLTESSDTSSSLSSKISLAEIKLEDVIGGGGFGQVWRAKWKGTPVAVKVLTGAAQAETVPKAVLEEFIAEINMVSGMRHPNICLFMGACLETSNRAIVTELCENGSLWDALRSPLSSPYQVADGVTHKAWPLNLYESFSLPQTNFGKDESAFIRNAYTHPIVPANTWPWTLVKRVASGTARGMCYLHSGNPPVLHRDLKSANILLDESYTAKLADFGLSRLKAVRSTGMTGNCGTVQWMAPEVLCNEDYAEPADVYSFGIILWEMLTQECPYEGMTPIQCALSVLNENNRPVIPNWCPPSLRALIRKCVERDPKDRPSFSEILAALDVMP